MKKIMLLIAVTALILVAAQPSKAAEHPAYLHALSDLRAARWLIEHRPGNWKQTEDEVAAVKSIDAAINEIKRAAIDDGKDLRDHPPVQEVNERVGRLRKALELLRKTRGDVNKEEDNAFAQGLKLRALRHIDEAIGLTERAIANK